MADEKKGITVKIDANLNAEIREYLERHEGMTMAEFITLAVDDELHPKIQQKEGNSIDFMSGEYTINNLNNIKSKNRRRRSARHGSVGKQSGDTKDLPPHPVHAKEMA